MGGPALIWAYLLSTSVEAAILGLMVRNRQSGVRFASIALGGARVVLIFVVLAIDIGEIGVVKCLDPETCPQSSERTFWELFIQYGRITRGYWNEELRCSLPLLSQHVCEKTPICQNFSYSAIVNSTNLAPLLRFAGIVCNERWMSKPRGLVAPFVSPNMAFGPIENLHSGLLIEIRFEGLV